MFHPPEFIGENSGTGVISRGIGDKAQGHSGIQSRFKKSGTDPDGTFHGFLVNGPKLFKFPGLHIKDHREVLPGG